MLEFIKKNKIIVAILFSFYGILFFCHMQTFLISDDLPYSLYFREGERITNLKEVINNQIFDYSHISPRIFIHIIVQTLLIFGKTLWNFTNPLIICAIICLFSYILFEITGKKIKPLYLVLISMISFLLLYDFKYLIYWVAGSVNYVWVFLILLLFIIYYLKVGFDKKPVLTFFICLITAILCEASSIFVIVVILVDLLIKLFVLRENKKIIFKYLFYLFGAVIGFLFLMLSPSNMGRMVGFEDEWTSLSFVGKLLISIPTISFNRFNVVNIYNLFPLLWFVSLIYFGFKNDLRFKKSFTFLGILLSLGGFVFNNGFICLVLAILLLIYQIYILTINKDYKLIGILLSSYAILFSLAITPDYLAARTGIHTSLFMAMFTVYNILLKNDINKVFKIIVWVILGILLVIEITIYSYIGSVKNVREKSLNDFLNGKSDIIEIKTIKEPFAKFHMEPNSMDGKYYWAYAAYKDYYKLPDEVEFKVIK